MYKRQTYLNIGQSVGTPSVRTGLAKDVYLTLEPGAEPGGEIAVIRAFVKPMILWLWIGGLIMGIGTLLAAFPGKRQRRAIDPVSAPIGADQSEVVVGARQMSEGEGDGDL